MVKNYILWSLLGLLSGGYALHRLYKKPKGCIKNNIILFDFDGTLANSVEELISAVNQTLELSGYTPPITYDELRNTPLIDSLKKRSIPFYKLPFLQKNALTAMSKRIDYIHPFDDIKELLISLKNQGFSLGILTSNSKENVEQFLNHNELNLFDVIYSGASIFGKAKIFASFLEEYQIDLNKIVYVGDETRDIEAAHKVKVPIISVSWGCNSKTLLKTKTPESLVDTVKELQNAIAKHFNKITERTYATNI